MADYTSDRTGANIDTVLDNADAGNIGKDVSLSAGDLNNETTGFIKNVSSDLNTPSAETGFVFTNKRSGGNIAQLWMKDSSFDRAFIGGTSQSIRQPWQELYHTGNTGAVAINRGNGNPDGSTDVINLADTGAGIVQTARNSVNLRDHFMLYNPNGLVGGIKTTGTSTQFNTSSDPRLKDFKEAPTDAEVNAKFDDLFGCFKTFNWKSDVDGELVWGFDAHATIDAGLDMGSEGEGSRDLALGDVYDTTPAELDEDGVEIKAAIEHKVSPAGVDQSKAVPILLAKIEQLERRLAKAGI